MPENPIWSEQQILNAAYDESTGALKTTGSEAGDSTYAEDSIFVDGSNVTLMGVEIDDPTALAAMTEGDVGNLKGDLAGRLIVTLGTKLSETEDAISTTMITGTQVGDGAQVASLEVATSAGTLYGFWVTNNSGATAYYQIFDNGSLPADTTVPSAPSIAVSDQTTTLIDLRDVAGFDYSSGCFIAASSTVDTKTITGATSQIMAWKK